MFPGYHYTFREHGRKLLHKDPAIPDVALGVGAAEKLDPQQQRYYFGTQQVKPQAAQHKTQEDFNYFGEGAFIRPEDFPREGYKGLPLYTF